MTLPQHAIRVRVTTLCLDSTGQYVVHPTDVTCDAEQYQCGAHYDIALADAVGAGLSPFLGDMPDALDQLHVLRAA